MTKLIRVVMILLNLLAVLAFVLLKIGTIVSPNDMLLPAYASLALIPIVFVNILFVFFWLIFRKWWALLSASVLILFAGLVQCAFPIHLSQPKVDEARPKITLLSYNTMSTGMLKKHKENNPNQIIQYILDTDADIVCLQEFAVSDNNHQFRSDDFERIFANYPYKHVSFQLNKWKMNIGLATLSKYPIIEKRNIEYESDFNLSMFTDVVIGDDTLRIVNNHLESNRITARDMKKTSQVVSNFTSERLSSMTKYLSRKMGLAYNARAKQADAVAAVIKQSPYKVIACGDFNDVPASYTYSKIKSDMRDAFLESGNGLGWTFAHSYFRFRIDYILFDNTFRATNYKMGKLKTSDHFPIQCDVYLGENLLNDRK